MALATKPTAQKIVEIMSGLLKLINKYEALDYDFSYLRSEYNDWIEELERMGAICPFNRLYSINYSDCDDDCHMILTTVPANEWTNKYVQAMIKDAERAKGKSLLDKYPIHGLFQSLPEE